MKKIILGIVMILAIGIAFAGDKFADVEKNVLASFKTDFAGAKNVTWKEINGFEKATFTLGNRVFFAYYQPGGELVATTRNLLSDQLPIRLQMELKKGFSNFWITDLFEVSFDDDNSYYLTLEDISRTVVLKSIGFYKWEIQKTIKRAK